MTEVNERAKLVGGVGGGSKHLQKLAVSRLLFHEHLKGPVHRRRAVRLDEHVRRLPDALRCRGVGVNGPRQLSHRNPVLVKAIRQTIKRKDKGHVAMDRVTP